jgi:hypothetical protein
MVSSKDLDQIPDAAIEENYGKCILPKLATVYSPAGKAISDKQFGQTKSKISLFGVVPFINCFHF